MTQEKLYIKKILNNNAIITLDESGKEIVAMGKGMAFGKKSKEYVDIDNVSKIFILQKDNTYSDVDKMFASIPIEYFELSYEIIKYAKITYQMQLRDSLYLTVADHLHSAVERIKKGITINNSLLTDIQRFYPNEFEIGQNMIKHVEENLGITLPKEEAGFIAMQFIEGQEQSEYNQLQVKKMTEIIHAIMSIVKFYFKIDYDETSIYYLRFVTHLRYLVQRVSSDEMHDDDKDEMFHLIITQYQESYECVEKIANHLNKEYKFNLTQEEKVYLIIHIQKIIKASKKI